MAQNRKSGQAILLVVVGMSIFLFGALGLAIDGAQLYAHRQMAQVAVDAAAQAGLLSVFDGTDLTNAASSYFCSASPSTTACQYASKNGFGTAPDTVKVEYLTGAAAAAAAPVNLDPNGVSVMRVTATRNVKMGMIRMLGASSFTAINAIGVAAIVDERAPVPIIVLHPTLSASFQKNGGNTIVICGGPSRSIQVNSTSPTSISVSGNGAVDLSKAGPNATPGACNGTGADFGDFGGPAAYPGTLTLGSGKYIQPASVVKDPLLTVPQPALPGSSAPAVTTLPAGTGACPANNPKPPCLVYSPGRYNGGISIKKDQFALFKPGVYYMNGGGFHLLSNSVAQMEGSTDPLGVTGQGMVIFNTGSNTANDIFEISSNSGQMSGGNQYGNVLLGAPINSIYKAILFFEDRTVSASLVHSLSGGGGMSLTGTLYMTHPNAAGGFYQTLNLQGNPGSATQITGEIIVDSLTLGGNANITMNLDPNANLILRRVALVR